MRGLPEGWRQVAGLAYPADPDARDRVAHLGRNSEPDPRDAPVIGQRQREDRADDHLATTVLDAQELPTRPQTERRRKRLVPLRPFGFRGFGGHYFL